MSRVVAGAIVSNDGQWYYTGLRWEPLAVRPTRNPPGWLDGENAEAKELFKHHHDGQERGEMLAQQVATAGGTLKRWEVATKRALAAEKRALAAAEKERKQLHAE